MSPALLMIQAERSGAGNHGKYRGGGAHFPRSHQEEPSCSVGAVSARVCSYSLCSSLASLAVWLLSRWTSPERQSLPEPIIGTHDIIYDTPSPDFYRSREAARSRQSVKAKAQE